MEGAEDQHGHTAVLSLILGRPGLDPSAHPQLPTALPVHGDSSGPETSVWDSDSVRSFKTPSLPRALLDPPQVPEMKAPRSTCQNTLPTFAAGTQVEMT